MPERPDLAVLGAGPAGACAAVAASEAGLSVTLVDEAPFAGGQVYRAPLDGSPAPGSDGRAGDALRRTLADSGVTYLPGHRVWTVSTAPLRLSLVGPSPVRTIEPRALLIATGATERVVPFPGWTLPGVVGLAAATVLLKAPGPLPKGPVVVAGRGPLLAATAAGLLARQVEVACVVDGATRADWMGAVPALLSRPALLARGGLWLSRIRRAGVPILYGQAVVEAFGADCLEAVEVRPVDRHGHPQADQGRIIPAHLLAVGHGLVPAAEALALLGVPLHDRPGEGAFAPEVDGEGRTRVAGLYAAGDGTGIRGAGAAAAGGRLAGLTVAKDLGAISAERHAALASRLHRSLRREGRAGAAMARLMTPPAGQFAQIRPDTVVCRCEDVTRAEIDGTLAGGASDLNQLKARTRCGMGPCQGRVCAPAVAALAALHPHVATPLRPWTSRPPLRTMPIADLVGAFRHDDIPSVKPAI